MLGTHERRVRRSDNKTYALHHLLAAQRERAGLGALLLATDDGFLLAHDGDRDACEELAAYAPFVARGEGLSVDPRRLQGVAVHTFPVGNQEVLLVLQGDGVHERFTPAIVASIEGALRILSA